MEFFATERLNKRLIVIEDIKMQKNILYFKRKSYYSRFILIRVCKCDANYSEFKSNVFIMKYFSISRNVAFARR